MLVAAGLMGVQRIKYRLPRTLAPGTDEDWRPVTVEVPGIAGIQG